MSTFEALKKLRMGLLLLIEPACEVGDKRIIADILGKNNKARPCYTCFMLKRRWWLLIIFAAVTGLSLALGSPSLTAVVHGSLVAAIYLLTIPRRKPLHDDVVSADPLVDKWYYASEKLIQERGYGDPAIQSTVNTVTRLRNNNVAGKPQNKDIIRLDQQLEWLEKHAKPKDDTRL